MRPGPNAKRGRGRANGRKPPPRNQSVDSSGPSVRVRGNAYQVLEKYLALARDASASGDRISAENYFQHAEHYYRVVNAANGGQNQNRHQQASGPADQPQSSRQSSRPPAQAQPPRQPAAEQPAVTQPVVEQPAAEQPGVTQPVAEPQSSGARAAESQPKADKSRTNGSGQRENQNGADEAETPDSDQPIV